MEPYLFNFGSVYSLLRNAPEMFKMTIACLLLPAEKRWTTEVLLDSYWIRGSD